MFKLQLIASEDVEFRTVLFSQLANLTDPDPDPEPDNDPDGGSGEDPVTPPPGGN